MDAVPGVLEYTVARAVSSAVLPRFSDRKRGRGPVFAATLVPDINRFRGRIGNRIVRPTRQAVALTVFIPGKTRSRFRNQGAEARIGNYVRPRGRCVAVRGVGAGRWYFGAACASPIREDGRAAAEGPQFLRATHGTRFSVVPD